MLHLFSFMFIDFPWQLFSVYVFFSFTNNNELTFVMHLKISLVLSANNSVLAKCLSFRLVLLCYIYGLDGSVFCIIRKHLHYHVSCYDGNSRICVL